MKCNLCGNNKMELFLETYEGNYLKCKNCGLIQRDNIPEASDIREFYNQEYFTQRRGDGTGADFIGEEKLYLARFSDLIDSIERRVKKGRILDIGASVGQFLYVAKKAGWEVSGIEISEAAVAIAKQRYGVDLQVGTIEDMNQGKDFFDVITLWHVFEHLPDPTRSLKNIHGLLVKDGLLVIELPNIESLEAVKAGRDWRYLRPREHLYHYTPDTIKMFLKKTGFIVDAIEYKSGGTGIGERIEKMGIGKVKRLLIRIFPFVGWIKKMLSYFLTPKDSKELIVVYARKKG